MSDWADLNGETAIVTGGSGGLGRGITLALAEAGAHVVAVARNEAGLAETVALVAAQGGSASWIRCDITDADSVEAMNRRVLDERGSAEILVNNAGVAWERPFHELTLDEFDQTLRVNVLGTFLVTQAVGRGMMERSRGRIVNIGSIDGVAGAPGLAHYCASKGAVVQLTRALATEWARYGITVNCVCPGYFPTDINRDRLAEEKVQASILRRIPMRRYGRIEELVPWVVLMASPSNSYTTGQVVVVDGGETAR